MPEPIVTTGAPVAPHGVLFESEKNFSPQLICWSFAITTVFSAAETCDHFELGPPLPRPLSSSSMEPDLSWMIRTSGGVAMMGTLAWPQFPPELMPTSPPAPEMRPMPVDEPEPEPSDAPTPVFPPAPLPGVPVGGAAWPGVNPQPMTAEKRNSVDNRPLNRIT